MSKQIVNPHAYSDNITHQRIGIIGPCPPPLGGISVHVQRVAHKFTQQHNTVHIFDATRHRSRITRCKELIRFLRFNTMDHLHYHTLYHSSIEWVLVVLGQFFYHYKLTVVDHDCRNLYTRSWLFKSILRVTVGRIHQQVLIGMNTYQAYRDNNIPFTQNMTIESAFLPPNIAHQEAIFKTYPAELWTFLHTRTPRITMNAFATVILNDKDLYGIDTAVEIIRRLKNQYPHVGLVCALAQIGNQQHFDRITQFIITHQLQEHIFFLHGQKELWPLFAHTDLFIRPTLSDGFSVSIEEALYFGVTTVASNSACRPAQTRVYTTHDINDCQSVIQRCLHEQASGYTTMK